MQVRFRGRMFRTVALNSGWLLRAFWKLVISWMDAFIAKKIIIQGSGYKDTLLQYIDEKDLEKKYGGKKADISSPFFPVKLGAADEK